jgi:hypothetical protein
MADIIELEIVGKVTNLKPMLSTVSRLEREIVKSTKALDQNKISQDRYNKVLLSAKREYMALGTSAQKASGQVERMAKSATLASAAQSREITLNKQYAVARREATAANARHTAETAKANTMSAQAIATEERLKNKFVQGYAAMDIYTKELNDLSMARRAGIITTEQQTAAVERLNLQMSKGTGAFAAYGGGVAGATQKQSRLGVVAQQSGYQVGDFLVQIQSGANPMMAFGQQATQLVGVMSLFGGKMLFAGAALGIIIPLLTAVAGYFLRSRKAAKDAAGSIETFEEKLKSARSEVKGMAEDLRLMNSGFENAAELTLNDAIVRARDELREAREALASMGEVDNPNNFASQAYRTNPYDPSARQNVTDAERLVELRVEELEAAIALRGVIEEETRARERDASVSNQLHEERQRQQREAYEAGREAYEQRQEFIAEGLANISDVSQTAANAAAEVNEKWDTFFETVNNIRGSLSEAAFEALRISGVDMSGPITDAMKEAAELAGDLGVSLEDAISIGQSDVSSGIIAAAVAAKQLAADLNITFRTALAMQGMISNRPTNDVFDPRAGSYDSSESSTERLRRLMESGTLYDSMLPDSPSSVSSDSPPSGGGNSSSDQLDFVEALRAEMVVRGELVKLYGDEYELQSEIARIVKGLGEDSEAYNAQDIAALAQQNILLKEQEVLRDEAAAQMENIYQMLGNEMGTAFTSMIDGTKSVEDAFKSMAKNIIDQLIQIFIVEQMVNSISGGMGNLFGSANGNVFSGGSQVQAYANGGVVNGPTMFPMNGNKTGLMGEAGPEAIMPLKRGANGKLGVQAEGSGGDNVVIHQNFNFQASGDDSVKKLIQQAAPQIAQMTKSSMLNDRRRGGQTKAVFG